MMNDLDLDYNMGVDNMLQIEEIEYPGWILNEGEFYSNSGDRKLTMSYLQYDFSDNHIFKIFKMTDRYVLKTELDGVIEYFYSLDINDLLSITI